MRARGPRECLDRILEMTNIESIYVRDPDGNLIEVSNYLDGAA